MQDQQAGSSGVTARNGEPARSLVAPLIVLLQHPRRLVRLPLLGVLVAGAIVALRGLNYTAESTFTPQTAKAQNLAGLALQFGMNINPGGDNQSAVFYTKLLKAQELLREAVLTHYRFPRSEGSADTLQGTLVELYGVGGGSVEKRIRNTVDRLDDDVYVAADLRADMVTVRVIAPWPDLAAALNRRLLELVSQFNLEKRQSKARAERMFAEQRVREAQQQLQRAEDELELFTERNRRYQDSPSSAVQAARLQRQVNLRQQVYTSLAQAYEQARVDEVRDTPVITIVDRPEGTVRPNTRVWVVLLMGFLIGGLVAVVAAFGQDAVARQRRVMPMDYLEFQRLRRSALVAWLPGRLARYVTRAPRETSETAGAGSRADGGR